MQEGSSPSRRRPRPGSSTCSSAITRPARCAAMSASTRERLADQPIQPRPRLPVRQGLSRDHLRSGADQRALSGDRPARRRLASPRRSSISSSSPSRFRASSGSRSTIAAGSPAASCSSICPRARRAASGSTPGSTIPNGSMSGSSARRSAPASWPIPRSRSRRCSGGCSTRRTRFACSRRVAARQGLPLQPRTCARRDRAASPPRSRPRWSTTRA